MRFPILRVKLGAKLWLIITCLLTPLVHGDTLVLSVDETDPQIPRTIDILEDPEADLTFKQALAQTSWRKITTPEMNQGITDSAWWVKFSLQGNPINDYLLVIDATLLEEVDIWLADGDNDNSLIKHYAVGTKRPLQQYPIPYRKLIAPLEFTTTENLTVILRARSSTSIVLPLQVWLAQEFWRVETIENVLYGIFIGAIMLISLYNLLLFWSTRDWAFFFYVVYCLPMVLTSIIFEGWGVLYIWPNQGHLNTYFLGGVFLLNSLGMLLFARFFLRTPLISLGFSRIFDGFILATAIAFLLTALGLPFNWVTILNILLFLGNIVVSVAAGILSLLRLKNVSAKYFLIARSTLFISGIILIVGVLGGYENSVVLAVSVPIGVMSEALLLSFALANRINTERYLRLQAHQSSIEAQAESRAKSRFLASMSHEIRTPMNGILGMVQLLEDTRLESQQQSYLNIIKSSGKSLLTIINDILDLSKINAGKMTLEKAEINLRELIDEAISLLTYEAGKKNLTLQADLDEKLPDTVIGDPTRLRQILINLLGNAVKFTPSGGVTLSVQVEANDMIRFAIQDSGIGIPKERVDNLFEAFEQADDATSRNFGGTGLGLTICKQLVHLMGGDIGVNSELGKGSEFWFSIPLPSAHSHLVLVDNINGKDLTAESQSLAVTDVQAMVVEDNEVNQMVINGLLKKLGIKADIFSNGQDALNHYQQHHGVVDVILMDCEMPGMDGYECTRKIREFETQQGITPSPVCALTAHAMLEHREKSFNAGMNDHVSKPINLDQLKHVIQRMVNPI